MITHPSFFGFTQCLLALTFASFLGHATSSTTTPSFSPHAMSIPTVSNSTERSALLPSLSGCRDTKGKFKVTQLDGTEIFRSCTWVGSNIERRCKFDGVVSQCQKTCGTCSEMPSISPVSPSRPTLPISERVRQHSCTDKENKFMVTSPDGRVSIKSCTWVRGHNTEQRCRYGGVVDQCQKTCGACLSSEVSATIAMKVGPINGKLMTRRNKFFFQDVTDLSLIELFMSTTTAIEDIKTSIYNQVTTKEVVRQLSSFLRRNAQQEKKTFLFFDLKVSGRFEFARDEGNSTYYRNLNDAWFDKQLKTFFIDSAFSVILIDRLINDDSSAAEYFQSIEEVSHVATDENVKIYPGQQQQEGVSGRKPLFSETSVVIITVCTVTACAVIILIAGVFMKRKINKLNEVKVDKANGELVVQKNESNESWLYRMDCCCECCGCLPSISALWEDSFQFFSSCWGKGSNKNL